LKMTMNGEHDAASGGTKNVKENGKEMKGETKKKMRPPPCGVPDPNTDS